MYSMADRIIEMTRQMAEMDVNTLPAPIFLGHLRLNLVNHGFAVADAELVASRMKITLAPDSMTEEQLSDIAGHYATILVKIRDALSKQGFENPMLALTEMAADMSLACN